jgi:hypothetical protein
MGAAEKISAGLDTMPDNLATAMIALRGECVNSAFEAIKVMRDA